MYIRYKISTSMMDFYTYTIFSLFLGSISLNILSSSINLLYNLNHPNNHHNDNNYNYLTNVAYSQSIPSLNAATNKLMTSKYSYLNRLTENQQLTPEKQTSFIQVTQVRLRTNDISD